MSSPDKVQQASIGQLALRWCCYGLLWIGTVLSIASVSVCDFHGSSYSYDADDNVFSTDDFSSSGSNHFGTETGLFCFRVVAFGQAEKQFYSELDDDQVVLPSTFKSAQAFGVMAVIFIPMALILFHVAFFVKLRNLAMAKGIWWTIRVLSIAALVSVSLTFLFYVDNKWCTDVEGVDGVDVDCRMGPGAILSIINAILLLILTVCLFVSGPPQSPFRCACNSCKEGPASTNGYGKTTPTVSAFPAKSVTTTTTEEIMEDGRRCITTETVDVFGNKQITKKMSAPAQ